MHFHLSATVLTWFFNTLLRVGVVDLNVPTKANLVARTRAIDAAPVLFFPSVRLKRLATDFALLGHFHGYTPIKYVLVTKPSSLSRRYSGQQDARIDYTNECSLHTMTVVPYRLDMPIIAQMSEVYT